MPLIKLGNYTPDVVDYEGEASLNISGCLPRGDGYAPIPAPQPYSQALAGPCRGAFVGLHNDGTVSLFAATATNLYVMNNTTLAWSLVSKSGGYAGVPSTDNWQFAQFYNFVIAVQANTVPQYYDLTSSSVFADMTAGPGYVGTVPTARYVSIVGRFVVLSGLVGGSTAPYTVQWSGLNLPFTWDGTNSSGSQILPDGGVVRGVAGGEGSGFIFQDFAIRTMTYTQEAVLVFQIQRISQDRGLYGPYTLTRAGEQIFYLAPQGLHNLAPGGLPNEVGKSKFNRTLMADIDRGNLQLAISAIDPRQSRIFLAYKSNGNPNLTYDKLLCYDYLLDKATLSPLNGEYFLALSQPGVTLESLDALAPGQITVSAAADNGAHSTIGGLPVQVRLTLSALSAGAPPGNYNLGTPGNQLANSVTVWGATGGLLNIAAGGSAGFDGTFGFVIIDATHIDLIGPTFAQVGSTGTATLGGSEDQTTNTMLAPFDTYAGALTPEMAHFDTAHQLNWFRGPPMQAIMDSGEQGTDARRLRVRGFRPITDAPIVFGSLVARETVQAQAFVTTETAINALGICPQNLSTRYARARIRIPAGTIWNYCIGVEPDAALEGLR